MTSKDVILKSIRRHLLQAIELPNLETIAGAAITYEDPRQQFSETLTGVGGQVIVVQNRTELLQQIEQLPVYQEATHVCSVIPGLSRANVDLDAIDDPHDLDNIDLAILQGHFGVAENAAIWVTDAAVKHRVIYFLPQHLVITVPAQDILNNMHEGYQRLKFEDNTFGTFISGPSKTADIEQSLVIGAHGARSLTVFLIEQPED